VLRIPLTNLLLKHQNLPASLAIAVLRIALTDLLLVRKNATTHSVLLHEVILYLQKSFWL